MGTSNIADIIAEKLTMMLPLYIMGSATINTIILLLIPSIFPMICDKLKNWYYSRNSQKVDFILTIYSRDRQGSQYINYSYNNVMLFVSKHVDGMYNMLEDTVYLYDSDKYIPRFKPSIGSFEYTFKSSTLKFEHNERGDSNKPYYVLDIMGADKKIIHDFVDYCNNWYIEDKNKVEKTKYCIYQNNDKEWRYNEINVVKNFENVFIPQEKLDIVQNTLHAFIENKEHYKRYGIPYKLGYLFYGIPGCGKSSTIFAICQATQRNIYSLNCSDITTKSQLLELINEIPSGNILVIEEIDTCQFAKNRDAEPSNSLVTMMGENFLPSVLNILDGYSYLNDTIIIFTTNHIEKLDEAIIRPGRIDHKIEFTYIKTEVEIKQILKFYFPCTELGKIEIPSQLTSSHLINTFILPNLDDYNKVISLIDEMNTAVVE